LNKAFLMGRLTRDPELRYTQAGVAVCTFTLAVDRRMAKDKTDFLEIVAWRKTAEFCGQYFTKGSRVVVIGPIQTRTWEDDNGQKRKKTEIIAEEVHFADSKRQANDDTDYGLAYDGFTEVDDDDELPF